MELIVVTALVIGLALWRYARRRKSPVVPDFDGGFRHQHPRVTTIIYSKDVHHKNTP